jgi:hypothetical protein
MPFAPGGPPTPPLALPGSCAPTLQPLQAALSAGRIYLADRADVIDPPVPPPTPGSPTSDVYNPRPAVYWAWLQPTFTAYGPCACYWNFNWGWVGLAL